MSSLFFRTKLDTPEQLTADPGQPLSDGLRRHGIPRNAVLAWCNSEILAEDTTVLEPDDILGVRQVHHHDLDVDHPPG